MELTGARVNEARELPKAVIDGLTHRVGRYPTLSDGGANPGEVSLWILTQWMMIIGGIDLQRKKR